MNVSKMKVVLKNSRVFPSINFDKENEGVISLKGSKLH